MKIVEDFWGNKIVVIENEDGSTVSMPKEVYDSQVEHLTEIIPSETSAEQSSGSIKGADR